MRAENLLRLTVPNRPGRYRSLFCMGQVATAPCSVMAGGISTARFRDPILVLDSSIRVHPGTL